MTDLARSLRRLAAAADPQPDGDLLARFAGRRDEDAFTELVRRHGPMVLAVCRRVLGHVHDAEDAFQATFLVLARRAAAVRPRPGIGDWLHGVAYRTALSARRVAATRAAREVRAGAARAATAAGAADDSAPGLREALDRELAALPEPHRAAVVACELEGLSRRVAAARLGISEGTLSSRLARARALLARRLRKYGLAVPAAGVGVVASPVVVAGELLVTTTRLGVLVAAGEAVVPAAVFTLMEGAMKAMLLTKLKAVTAAVVVGCAVLATGTAGWRADAAGGGGQVPADPARPAEGARRPARDADKERIAELERERAKLLAELAAVHEKMALLEARLREGEKGAVLEARLRDAELKAARDLLARRSETFRELVAHPAPPGAPALPAADPFRPPSSPPAPGVPATAVTPPAPANPLAAPSAIPRGIRADTPPKPSVRVYAVGDLAANEREGEALAKVVRAAVEPRSWAGDAGVEYLPGRKVLVVRQTAAAHDEVARLLDMLKAQAAPPGPR